MNTKKLIYLLAVGVLFTTACSKDFLDKSPTDVISADDLANAVDQDPGLLAGNVAGLYTTMFVPETGGTTGHDDFGQKAQDINMDLLTSDMVIEGTNYGWFGGVSRYQPTLDFTRNEAYVPWRYYYRMIFAANTIIDALGGTDVDLTDATAESRFIMGQAKAMRAYSYFYLAQLYSKEGYGTGAELILPIYLKVEEANKPLSSTKEVYDLIVADLRQSIDYLQEFNRTSKSQINQYVAKGLLAYALMARGGNEDWQETISITNDIIANSGHPLTTRSQSAAVIENGALTNPESGFNNIATASWMWGTDLTVDNNLDLASWWGHMDYYTYSYASSGDAKLISKDLYNLIPSTDVRKRQFHATRFLPIYKIFDPARQWDGQRPVTTDLLYMRIDEFYLLNAEANANLNQDLAAITSLRQLLTLRLDNVSYLSALSGQALKDEIYLQTRIELWGEGKIYLANKRNKRTVTVASNHLFNAGESIPFNAQKLTFPIPQAEILNNPHLN